MATTATPYGFKPLNHIGGTPYAGAVRHIKIASGFGTNIFNGSIVNIVTISGKIIKSCNLVW